MNYNYYHNNNNYYNYYYYYHDLQTTSYSLRTTNYYKTHSTHIIAHHMHLQTLARVRTACARTHAFLGSPPVHGPSVGPVPAADP